MSVTYWNHMSSIPPSAGRVPQLCGEYRRPQNPVNCPLSMRCGEGMALVSPLVYDPRARWALRWLFVRVSLTGATPGRPPPPGLAPPTRTRSTEPEAFEGLTPTPPGALCERETPPAPAPPPGPPV